MSKIYGIIDIEDVEKLAKIVNDNDLGELTISAGDDKSITVKGRKTAAAPYISGMPLPMPVQPGSMPPVSPADRQITPPLDTPVPDNISGTPVKAPIVGTFYSKPRPDAAPFVTIGSKVKKGDILYILETMKVMNEVAAEEDGIVSKILVSDGDALEYGQTVMILN